MVPDDPHNVDALRSILFQQSRPASRDSYLMPANNFHPDVESAPSRSTKHWKLKRGRIAGNRNSMKNLFQASAAEEIERRVAALKPDSHPLWGMMNVAQMVAHCSAGLELASGDRRPPRALIGRVIGWAIKPMVLRNDEPMRRNSPTVEGLVVRDKRDLEIERKRLLGLINQFVAAGSNGCTKHPHSFFGQLTPDEWAILMYKHLDHHLRQFGV
jgi:Protein of unknown function (DUF1569)